MKNTKPKNIALYIKTFNSQIISTLKATYAYLSALDLTIYLEKHTADTLDIVFDDHHNQPNHAVIRFEIEHIPSTIDLLIVIGGDGSMLKASHFAINQDIPLLGINLGNLGFLADITPDNIQSDLNSVLNGNYLIEERFLLSAQANLKKYIALNEITLTSSRGAQLIEFDVYINNQLMYQQHSDGLIIATPTGSTAYALSGGGPILQPTINAIELVPMFPHSLSMRPIVISGDSEITIRSRSKTNAKNHSPLLDNHLNIHCDGQEPVYNNTMQAVTNQEIIRIKKHPRALKLIHPPGYNYYQSLRSKLHWGKKPSK